MDYQSWKDSHFTNESTEVRKLNDLPMITMAHQHHPGVRTLQAMIKI